MTYERQYYWIMATHQPTGRAVILGPYATEDQASQVGFEKIDGPFEVLPLPTRDTGRATKMLKYKRFDRSARLEEALKRAKHDVNTPQSGGRKEK